MNKNLKKVLAMATVCTAVCGFSAVSQASSFQLSDEVKAPTAALLEASQIGILSHETAALQNLPNKDAILVMSFGTTFPETRAKNIEATVQAIQAQHPDTKVVVAFTSHMMIDRVRENEGLTIPTPEQALDQLKAAGYTRVAMTTLDVIPGIEYTYKKSVYDQYKGQFKKMTMGTPLMFWQGQEGRADDVTQVMEAVSAEFPKLGKRDAVVLMAHGTPHQSNAYYSVMQAKLQAMGLDKALIFTVEGWPTIDEVVSQLHAKNVKRVVMMPLMMVAGDHASNDMAGDEEDSFKTALLKEGFKVDVKLQGLGENAAVQKIFVERAEDAWKALQE